MPRCAGTMCRVSKLPAVFTTAEALRAGYALPEIRQNLRRGDWFALERGAFCTAEMLAGTEADGRRRHALTARALLGRQRREAWISHCSAAYLYGLPLPKDEPRRVSMTAESGVARSYESMELQVGAVPLSHRAKSDGLPITSAARTVVDLARHLRPRDSIAIGDAALHHRLTDRDSLTIVLGDCQSWRGIIAARSAVERMDGRRESWLESQSSCLFVEHALPAPDPQVWIADVSGDPFARVDFLWEPPGVIGEADGAVKYRDDDGLTTLIEEKRRQQRLEELGFLVVRWDTADIMRHSWRTAHRIQVALDAAWRARSRGVPVLGRAIRSA